MRAEDEVAKESLRNESKTNSATILESKAVVWAVRDRSGVSHACKDGLEIVLMRR